MIRKYNKTLKKGEQVVMIGCVEAKTHDGMVWECVADSFKDIKGHDVVALHGLPGHFKIKFLQRVDIGTAYNNPSIRTPSLKERVVAFLPEEFTITVVSTNIIRKGEAMLYMNPLD